VAIRPGHDDGMERMSRPYPRRMECRQTIHRYNPVSVLDVAHRRHEYQANLHYVYGNKVDINAQPYAPVRRLYSPVVPAAVVLHVIAPPASYTLNSFPHLESGWGCQQIQSGPETRKAELEISSPHRTTERSAEYPTEENQISTDMRKHISTLSRMHPCQSNPFPTSLSGLVLKAPVRRDGPVGQVNRLVWSGTNSLLFQVDCWDMYDALGPFNVAVGGVGH
jgi:hypothetical protein